MSKEIWTMPGVGVALGMLLFHTTGGLRGEVAELRERMARVETTLQLVVQGLHVEIKGDNP